MPIEQFSVSFPDAALEDLQRRLDNATFPHDFANDDWTYGTNLSVLKDLVAYWRDDYDWRAAEAEINKFDHYRTEVDGLPIHFIREPGKGPNPMPLILSHGWPWVFWDLHRVIGPLTNPAAHGGDPEDAFEVIVPSMPGFGFSTPLETPGINFWRTADLWHDLMTKQLGFEKFAAQGGDWGALTTAQLGHRYADSLFGIHLTSVIPLTLFNHERPWDITGGTMAPPELEGEAKEAFLAGQRRIASHVCVHVLDPQTLAYGLHDSPVGLLAWLLERRRAWGDTMWDDVSQDNPLGREHLITTTMLYWLTRSFVTSARFYAEAAHNPWRPDHDKSPLVNTPTGITYLGGDIGGGLRGDSEKQFDVRYVNEHPTGGHFAPFEEPKVVVNDIRATFRDLR